MSKKLLVHIAIDVSDANNAQVEALKAFYRASFDQPPMTVQSIEVISEPSPDDMVKNLMRRVHSEFVDQDQRSRRPRRNSRNPRRYDNNQ